MQLLNRYQRVMEKLLRPGTRRRYYYGLGLAAIRVIINEGWRSFWVKGRRWLGARLTLRRRQSYRRWIVQNEPTEEELATYREECLSFSYRPKISIVTPVWNTEERWLRAAIDSVIDQVYDNWELCLADGGSSKEHVSKVLQEYAKRDSRIKVRFLPENKGIAGNSNEALSMATGEFVASLDHDDELAPFALYEVVKLLNQNPEVDFIYSDEDKMTAKGERISPFFKPDWSPDMFLSCMYTCHLGVYRKKIIDEIGGLRLGYDGSQDYDLVLRFIEKTDRISHIPKILYHWRGALTSSATGEHVKRYACAAAKKAIADHLERNNIGGEVLDGPWTGSYRVKRSIIANPLVSIIIPTRDKLDLLQACIESVLHKTAYDNYEIIIVNNQSQEQETLSYLDEVRKHPRIRILEYDKPFNFSAINNFAVSQAHGKHVLFLNNDTEVISTEWLSAMLEHSQRKEVGAIGAKLLFPKGTIQHCGVIIGPGGAAIHAYRQCPDQHGYAGVISIIRNYSAVTGACVMMRKEVFNELGGFDENLEVVYNDIDLCLRIRDKGYLIVYTPYALLRHHEFASRPKAVLFDPHPHDTRYFNNRWRETIERGDPYYNPNLTLDKNDFSLRISPEVTRIMKSQSLVGRLLPVGARRRGFFQLGLVAIRIIVNEGWRSFWRQSKPKMRRTAARRPSDSRRRKPDVGRLLMTVYIRILPLAQRAAVWIVRKLFGRNERLLDGLRLIAQGIEQVLLSVQRLAPAQPSVMESVGQGAIPQGFGVNVAGYATGEFGVAAGARALIHALEAVSIPYVVNNLESTAHSSLDTSVGGFSLENPYQVNLIHVNAEEVLWFVDTRGADYFANRHNIGYWAWELSRFPEEWFDRFRYYDEIWVPSTFTLDSISRASPVPVVRIPLRVCVDETRIESGSGRFGLDDHSYVFLFTFDFHSFCQRKNPLALIEAFRTAFGGGKEAVLVLKCINADYHRQEMAIIKDAARGANVRIMEGHLRKDDYYSLVAACDCYVSLHRSEGFGLTLAEAMYLKKPVIATAYSGNMDFMNPNNSFLVKYKLVEVGEKEYPPFKKGYVWADPDVGHAAELMRFLYENGEYGRQIGEKASEDIRRLLSPAVVGQEIAKRLELVAKSLG